MRYRSEGQLDLFHARASVITPRDAQDLMSWPFFSLAKSRRLTPIDFRMGEVSIRVEAKRQYLPNGVPLLKRVWALKGTIVCRQGTAIIIHGVTVGLARERDSRGRPLPAWQGCRVIADGEVFLMNRDAADSFDGRYFGPLPLTSIIGRAVPVWVTGRTAPTPNVPKDSVLGAP
ncbi:S26 family signal peptidase [Mesorhizobium australicum]|uniref:S26 family signal peptidase n=1 Tax=Mesorhizobium australicum TaxID=536018 RepID=UPI003339F0C8